jgi:hypothetical protein
MTEEALKFLVVSPGVAVQADLRHVALTFKVFQQDPAHPEPSESKIHLGMTTETAMNLLALLKFAQERFGLPESSGPVSLHEVPRDLN